MKNAAEFFESKPEDFPFDGTEAEKLEFLVKYAVLAPSKYNVQPWLFEICSDSVDVICERHDVLRVADPQNRELIMSCGAAVFNFRVAAAFFGYGTSVQAFPNSSNQYLTARLCLTPRQRSSTAYVRDDSAVGKTENDSTPSVGQLFKALQNRHTFRGKFRDAMLPDRVLALCREAAASNGAWLQISRNKWTGRKIAGLVADADREQMANKLFRQELAMWIRGANDKDGISASAVGLPSQFDRVTSGFLSLLVYSVDMGHVVAAHDRCLAEKSPVLAVLGTSTNTPEAWLAAGQALEAVLVYAAAAGVSASFLNQPMQVNHLRTDLIHVTGCTGFPQALLRLGYGEQGQHTPRRPLDEVVINPIERRSNMKTLKNKIPTLRRFAKRIHESSPAPTQTTTASSVPVPPPAESELQEVAIHRTFLNAKSVMIAGTFNGWKPSGAELQNCGHDSWRVNLILKPGRYEYRFVVDEEWTDDPVQHNYVANPYGGHNTVLIVAAPDKKKSETTKIPTSATLN